MTLSEQDTHSSHISSTVASMSDEISNKFSSTRSNYNRNKYFLVSTWKLE